MHDKMALQNKTLQNSMNLKSAVKFHTEANIMGHRSSLVNPDLRSDSTGQSIRIGQ